MKSKALTFLFLCFLTILSCKKDSVSELSPVDIVSEAKSRFNKEFSNLYHRKDYLQNIDWDGYKVVASKNKKTYIFQFTSDSVETNSYYYYIIDDQQKADVYVKISSPLVSYDMLLSQRKYIPDTLERLYFPSPAANSSNETLGIKFYGNKSLTQLYAGNVTMFSSDLPFSCNGCHTDGIPLDGGVVITPSPPPSDPFPDNPFPGGGTPSPPPAATEVKNRIQNNPFALIDLPCDVIKKWKATANYKVPDWMVTKLDGMSIDEESHNEPMRPVDKSHVAYVQNIADAYSTVVNMDYFPVTINTMPTINGHLYIVAEFLHYLRVNINDFTNGTTFTPYNAWGIDDRNLWNSDSPSGSMIAIDMEGPDNGTVMTSFSSSNMWTFTTVHDPMYGDHPVSGNRDFGYTTNADNSVTFFTRGVDRLTNWDATAAQALANIPFGKAEALWTSFQNGINSFVSAHGGASTVNNPQISRPNWDVLKQVLNGTKPLSTLDKNCPD